MTGLARGRLPARVYWVRRLMVLGVAMLLVVGIGRLLGGSSDASSGPDRATRVADTGTSASAPPTTAPTTAPTTDVSPRTAQRTKTPTSGRTGRASSPAAMPTGPCRPDDIAITPSVPHPVAGGDIAVVLDLSTVASPACSWTLSGRTLALKITSGSDLIWTTVECAREVPAQDLVLRNTQPTRVTLTWNARRSEPGCPRLTEWALPGTYHLQVAALAGRPQEATFLLTAPSAPEVTRTAKPHRHHSTGG
jgi:hypothetical protein